MLQLLPVLKAENEILTANGSLRLVVALWPLLVVLTVNSKGVILWYKTYPGFTTFGSKLLPRGLVAPSVAFLWPPVYVSGYIFLYM